MALRLARTADCYLPLQPSSLQRWDQLVDANGLCNVAASRFLRPYRPSPPLLEPLRLHRVISALEEAARSRRLFHLWWHPHNFGANGEENLAFLAEVIGAFERLRESHGMRSMTMAEVADEALSAAARR